MESWTNYRLATALEKQHVRAGMTHTVIFALAAHGQERFLTIIERLGDTHPAVIDYTKQSSLMLEMVIECRLRLGDSANALMYPTLLRASPRYRRIKEATK